MIPQSACLLNRVILNISNYIYDLFFNFFPLPFKDLTVIMATSTDYNELEYVWTKWREAAGKPIRKQYLEFVALNNKAADLNGNKIDKRCLSVSWSHNDSPFIVQ